MIEPDRMVSAWRERLENAGLGGLAAGLSYALRPLGPLAAQLLWFSQPAFGLFGRGELAGALAEYLEMPEESDNRGRDAPDA